MYTIFGADGNEYGPVEKEVLIEWAQQGRVIERTMLLEHATSRKFLACDLPELAAVFNAPPQIDLPVPPPTGVSPYAAYPAYPAYNPYNPYAISYRKKVTAGLLGIFLGCFGVHRFYLGYTGIGMLQLLLSTVFAFFTCGLTFFPAVLWGLIEGILCFTGSIPDAEGRRLAD